MPRNVFGNIQRIVQRNSDNTERVERSFVYQGDQRLCKSVEPETGATIYGYDNAGNVTRVASGLSGLSEPGLCNQADAWASGRTVLRSYDERNRVRTLSFPDGNGDQVWVYTLDGLPEKITTQNSLATQVGFVPVENIYSYNRRRLLIGESSRQGATPALAIGYGYSSLGHLASNSYPDGLTITYLPNALGQPTQAGTFATGVKYHPSGAIKQFTYGNGIVHEVDLNDRLMTARVKDSGAARPIELSYNYDDSSNLVATTDHVSGRQTRSMTYDGFDRLLTAQSSVYGGTDSLARYQYNALDDLVSLQSGSRNYAYVYNPATRRLDGITLGVGGPTIAGLSYDDQGNLKNKNGRKFAFDYGNRLRHVRSNADYLIAGYTYDALGRRVEDITSGSKTSVYSQAGQLMFEDDKRVAKSASYVYLGSRMVARVNSYASLPALVLSAPASAAGGSYQISWTTGPSASLYELQEAEQGSEWQIAYSGVAQTKAYVSHIPGIFNYRVRMCIATRCSPWSQTATVTVQLPAPPAPPLLSAPSIALQGNYSVSWQPQGQADSFVLEERIGQGTWSSVYSGAGQSMAFNAKPAAVYVYRARSCNGNGCGAYSQEASVESVFPPASPTLTAPATSFTGAFVVSWTSAGSATTYRLETTANGGAWTEIQNNGSTSKAESGKPAGNYAYRVRACNAAGCSGYSGTAAVQVTLPPATAPALAVPANSSTGNYTATWTAVASASTYVLQESVNGGGWASIYSGGLLAANIGGRSTGSYGYRISACNAAGCGPASTVTQVSVVLPPTGTPTLSLTSPGSNGSYTVTWTSVAAATTYSLEESTGGGAWTNILNGAQTSLAFPAKPPNTYAYRVTACNLGGCGATSLPQTVSVSAIPAAPTGFTGSGEALPEIRPPFYEWNIYWNSSAGATPYEVQMQVNTQAPSIVDVNLNTSWYTSGRGSRTFWVRACSSAGCSSWSGPLSP